MSTPRILWRQNQGLILAVLLFAVLYGIYAGLQPRGYNAFIANSNVNQGFAIALASMAQTVPVLTRGLDLSIGAITTLVDCLASVLVNGPPWHVALGLIACLAAGIGCGLLNGCIIVYGRIQPIIATLATGAMFMGFALLLRPTPGGKISDALSNALTYQVGDAMPAALHAKLFDYIPMELVILVLVVSVIWLPFRRSIIGRGCYAAGSSEAAAYMAGVNVTASKLSAYAMAGLLSAIGGLFLGLQTQSGDANVGQASLLTLDSIAAVVIGGTSLMGGIGGCLGSLFGAYILTTINAMLQVANTILWIIPASPLIQPLFEGMVLLLAVSAGAGRVFWIRNRLELFR